MTMTYAGGRNSDPEMDRIGRYRYNQATDWVDVNNQKAIIDNAKSQGVTNGVPIAGSYAPNAWGLYDMLGGVMELCLDYYQDNITKYNGAVNVNADGTRRFDGTVNLDKNGIETPTRVRKGGSWAEVAFVCRPGFREGVTPGYVANKLDNGLRVKCYMGLRKIAPEQ
jgi:formylglycine-generating enzyme required for sulfatase activity